MQIDDLLVVPEWGRLAPIVHDEEMQSPVNVAVGLQLSDGYVAWGYCSMAAGYLLPGWPRTITSAEVVSALRELVRPELVDQPITSFRELAAKVDRVQETIAVTKSLPPAAKPAVATFSRRGFLTAGLSKPEEVPAPRTQSFRQKRVLHPAVRYGLSQALLQAAAHANRRDIVQQLAYECGQEPAPAPLPLELSLSAEATLPVSGRISGFNYAVPLPTTLEILGTDAAIFEKWIRHVGQQLAPHRRENYDPTLVIDARGLLGEYFGHKQGKILGCLFGLDLAAKPADLWVLDPVCHENNAAQLEALQGLAKMAKRRRLNLKIGVSLSVSKPADLASLLESEAVQAVHIDLPAYGGLVHSLAAMDLCRQYGMPFTLGDSQLQAAASLEFLATVALVCQPARVVATDGSAGGASLRHLFGAMRRQALAYSVSIIQEEEE